MFIFKASQLFVCSAPRAFVGAGMGSGVPAARCEAGLRALFLNISRWMPTLYPKTLSSPCVAGARRANCDKNRVYFRDWEKKSELG